MALSDIKNFIDLSIDIEAKISKEVLALRRKKRFAYSYI
jgi:hypothetical protein